MSFLWKEIKTVSIGRTKHIAFAKSGTARLAQGELSLILPVV